MELFGTPPRCSTLDNAFIIPEDPEAYLPMFRAMCHSGAADGEHIGDDDDCREMLQAFSTDLFGLSFHDTCGALGSEETRSTRDSRVLLPASRALTKEGDEDKAMFDNAIKMIDPLFELGKQLEEENEDMHFYFSWVRKNPFFESDYDESHQKPFCAHH